MLAWLFAMAVAFRDPILSGFDLGFGDRADGIIEISLLEHWRNVLTGHALWNTPSYFHPHVGTLGYNDGYFLFGLVYSGWRLWADPFVADTLNAATFKTIGFFGAWWLARRSLGWEPQIALLIAVLFTIANGMTLQAVHAQLQSVALLPVAMILAHTSWHAEHARARVCAVALAALLGGWLITAYYLAWFAIWFACLWALCALYAHGYRRPAALLALLRPHRGTLTVLAIAFVIATVPFLRAYLPTVAETGGHGYMISYLITPLDPINVGSGNVLWGWIFRAVDAVAPIMLGPDPRVMNRLIKGEHETGFALVLFALFVLGSRRLYLSRRASQQPWIFALAVGVGWIAAARLWVVSPWILVHFLVPGASAIRVVVRYQLFLILPVLLVTAAAWRTRFIELTSRRPWVAVVLVALLIGEQVNLTPVAELSRQRQRADLGTIPRPPAGCASFYAVATRHSEVAATNPSSPTFRRPENEGKYFHNVDAMLLAQLWRVPTINGYSTFQPRDWAFADPLAPDYDARALRYAAAHGLTGLCRLDVRDPAPWRHAR